MLSVEMDSLLETLVMARSFLRRPLPGNVLSATVCRSTVVNR